MKLYTLDARCRLTVSEKDDAEKRIATITTSHIIAQGLEHFEVEDIVNRILVPRLIRDYPAEITITVMKAPV